LRGSATPWEQYTPADLSNVLPFPG
jgi:hypothetical protein